MPITDNNFTAEELAAAATANPELLKVVTTHLTGNKFIVRSEDENNEFLKNYEAKVVGDKTRDHAAAIEKDVFDLTGITKAGDEKYYDYMKRAFTTTKGALDKAQKDLDEARKGGTTTEADRQRIQKLEQDVEAAKKAHRDDLGKKDGEISKVKAESIIERGLIKLRGQYKANIPEGLIEMAENTVIGKLLGTAALRQKDGKDILVFLDEKGEIRTDPTTLNPLTAEYLLTDSLKDLIDEGKRQPGTGTKGKDGEQGGGGTGGDGEKPKFTALPGDVKTKVQLTEYLYKLGIMDGSEEYVKIFAEHGAKLPLR